MRRPAWQHLIVSSLARSARLFVPELPAAACRKERAGGGRLEVVGVPGNEITGKGQLLGLESGELGKYSNWSLDGGERTACEMPLNLLFFSIGLIDLSH